MSQTIDGSVDVNIPNIVTAALEDPQQVLARLWLYESAEQKQRHVEHGLSILRYALAGYLTGAIGDYTTEPITIEPFDDEVDVIIEPYDDDHPITVEYPAWLSSFFENEGHFEYLKPDNEIGLAEILFELQAHVGAYTIPLIGPAEKRKRTDAEAPATQGDDSSSESSESESEADDDNPGLDLCKINA